MADREVLPCSNPLTFNYYSHVHLAWQSRAVPHHRVHGVLARARRPTCWCSSNSFNCSRWSHLALTVDCHHIKCVVSSRQESCSSEDSVCSICASHILNVYLQQLPSNSSSHSCPSVGDSVACDLTVPSQTVHTVPGDGDAGGSECVCLQLLRGCVWGYYEVMQKKNTNSSSPLGGGGGSLMVNIQ